MRKCTRCKTEMHEDYTLKLENSNYRVVTAAKNSSSNKPVGTTNVAVCPKCGEVSIYVKNTSKKKESNGDLAVMVIFFLFVIGGILYFYFK